jgi:hypothetical protein
VPAYNSGIASTLGWRIKSHQGQEDCPFLVWHDKFVNYSFFRQFPINSKPSLNYIVSVYKYTLSHLQTWHCEAKLEYLRIPGRSPDCVHKQSNHLNISNSGFVGADELCFFVNFCQQNFVNFARIGLVPGVVGQLGVRRRTFKRWVLAWLLPLFKLKQKKPFAELGTTFEFQLSKCWLPECWFLKG